MKKYCKLLVSIIFIAIFSFLISNKVSAVSDYTIESYDINMVVNEDNTFDITEQITAFFDIPKHGIYRKIPLKNTVTREDGTTSNNRARITNISVNKSYTTKNENGYRVIQIGDSDRTVKGSQTYTIKYTYDLGKDPLEDADELYYNLIGTEWDTSISNISFNITMPKEFDKSLLGFSSGYYGTSGSSDVSYTVNDNVITGTFDSTLYAGEALTVRLTLPEGYFVRANRGIDFAIVGIIILCVASIICAFVLWSKYGKDDQVVETVEFYPPEGYNSAEIGFLYKGSVENKDAVSLLIYLANKGYLKIEETEKKSLFSVSKGFRITKLKDYDGNNEAERIFFNGLFVAKDSVTDSDLYNSFYMTIGKVTRKINSKENKNKIFEKTASSKGKWLILAAIAIFVLITIKVGYEYGGMMEIGMPSLFMGIGLLVFISTLSSNPNIAVKVFIVFWTLGFAGVPFLSMLLPIIVEDPLILTLYLIGIITIVILAIFAKIMSKRTKYGNEILGKIRGFKRFLETAEKEKLEALVNQDPEYFYNILPYTYVLGVSDVWMKKFETIAMEAPNWYYSNSAFDFIVFNSFMNNTMRTAQSVMTSSPSSSSSGGGGFSGGGFSGGGSGGGGGGSW